MSTVNGAWRGPNIVKDGLVVYVDAGSPNSYYSLTAGTTVKDISGNSKNGSFAGGTTYGSNNGGVFNFDGVNSTIGFGLGSTFFDLPSLTIDLWFQSKGTVPTTGVTPGLFGFTYGIRAYFTATNIQFSASSGSATQFLFTTGSVNYRDDGNWYNAVFQATPTNSYIYINGTLNNSRTITWLGNTIYSTNTWNLGRDNNNNTQFFTGSIASYRMYNRALTAAEVLQNYNATRTRFGL